MIAPGDSVYAAPDCPQIPYLLDARDPTGTFYDFLDADYRTPQRTERILALLDRSGVEVAIVNLAPEFSDLIARPLWDGLVARYPHARQLGPFLVLWGDPTPAEPATEPASARHRE